MPKPRPAQDPQRRGEILRVVREADAPLGISGIAAALGIHRNTVRFHLENLVQAGQVERATAAPTGRGRPPQRFRPAPGWDRAGPRQYRMLAQALLEHLGAHRAAETDAADAGYRWGGRLAAEEPAPGDSASTMDALHRGLDRLGFRPEPPLRVGAGRGPDEHRIDLRHCPFLELTDEPDSLVCRMHLGMLRGAVDGWRAPLKVIALEPKVEPDRCVVHLEATQR